MPKSEHEKMSRQARWFKAHGMTSIGLHGATYRRLDRLRRARSKAVGVRLLSWNAFIQILLEKDLRS